MLCSWQVIEKQLRIALGTAFPGTWNRKIEKEYQHGTQLQNPGQSTLRRNQTRFAASLAQTVRGLRWRVFDLAGATCLRVSWYGMLRRCSVRTSRMLRNLTHETAFLVQSVLKRRRIAFDFGVLNCYQARASGGRVWTRALVDAAYGPPTSLQTRTLPPYKHDPHLPTNTMSTSLRTRSLSAHAHDP
eukprot:1135728-Rhodomonas_salina.1